MIDVLKFFRSAKRCLRAFHLPGEPLIDFCVRARKSNPKNWSFWQMLCHQVRDSIGARIALINKAHPSSRLNLMAERDKVRPDSFIFKSHPKLESSIPEVNRWLPEIFKPLPDSETGGCARSDSLIAPAI
jgi:hypothetical protein